MIDLAWLLHLNRQRVLDVFIQNTADNREVITKYAFNTAQYLANDKLKALLPFFERAIEYEDNQENVAVILLLSWIHGEDVGYPLLQKLIQQSEKARMVMPEIAIRNLYVRDNEVNPKCHQLFYENLSSEKESLQDSYAIAFRHLKITDFSHIFQWLKDYATSKAGVKHAGNYYDYLLKCSSKYPKKCIQLMQLFNINTFAENGIRDHLYDDEPLKVVLGAYNALDSQIEKDKEYVEIAMQLFDEMLKNRVFRLKAVDVLNQVEI